jgi:hypothetical protein
MHVASDIVTMTDNGSPLLPPNQQQKESLLMLIVLNFAEAHDLLNAEQMEDAKASLRSLFLRATGEETMLRKIIGILNINRTLNKTFSEMANVLEAIRKSHHTLVKKHGALRQQLIDLAITPDENRYFVGPFMEFAIDFVQGVAEFDRQMSEYKEYVETEARSAHVFRLAHEARERLKQRFKQGASEDSLQEQQVKQKVLEAFDYATAETDYQYSQRCAARARADIEQLLNKFYLMSQLAMKPEMRDPSKTQYTGDPVDVDVYATCLKGMETFPRLQVLMPVVQELLRLYQRSFGMFMLDFGKFNNSLGPMVNNPEDYFSAKETDEDVRTKQLKLEKIEALIAFIEGVAVLLHDGNAYTYTQYSLAVSDHITAPQSKWSVISEQLLQMKVTAEADLTTRLA